MGVQIDIALDLDGNHTFRWQRSDDACALRIAPATLQRWSREHRAFRAAQQRWHKVMEEVDEVLLQSPAAPTGAAVSAVKQLNLR